MSTTTAPKNKKAPNAGKPVTDYNMHEAAKNFISRVAVSAFGWVCCLLAYRFDLLSAWLAVPVAGYFLAWLAFWAGAWMQFLWTRGGDKNG